MYQIVGWGFAYAGDFDVEVGPPDLRNFWLELRVDVQEVNKEGIINFLIYICSPLGLLENFNEIADYNRTFLGAPQGPVFGRGLLILREYNIDVIESIIEQEVDNLKYYAFDVS